MLGGTGRVAMPAALGLGLGLASLCGAEPQATIGGVTADQALKLGERMYREGLLPSGQPMMATVKGDVRVEGTTFTCVSCHLRAGLGSFEGKLVTLPTNAAKLFQPAYTEFRGLSTEERIQLGLQVNPRRPAYTDETLATALSAGLDPAGREFHHVMPRYELTSQDMQILIFYLRSLSVEPSPGVDATTMHLATVITDEVSEVDREAMLVPLDNFVAQHNTLAGGFNSRMYISRTMKEMALAYRELTLAKWVLKGPTATWPAQLEAYYQKEPVFALVGGISYGSWEPIHRFCESRQLPCLFPLTDYPVLAGNDWYTLYFSKGLGQEGQGAARYLVNRAEASARKKVIQVAQDTPQGRALAAGFQGEWRDLGQADVKLILLPKEGTFSKERLRRLIQSEKPTALLLWTGPEAFAALRDVARLPGAPRLIFMASGYLKGHLQDLPEQARAITYLTFPYRDPKEEGQYSRFANSLLAGLTTASPETRISTRAYSLIQLLKIGLTDMERNFYRDNLLDRISMTKDQTLPDFVRLSFGPGQRYASKGCYVMQLGKGPKPELVKKSDWVIH